MTVVPPEVKPDEALNQEKVDAISRQDNVDAKTSQDQIEAKADKSDDPNFKAFREGRKKDRAAREEAERRAEEKAKETEALKAALEATLSRPVSQPPQNQYNQYYGDQPPEESEDQRIERKVEEKLAKREQQARELAAQREREELPNRIRQQYPDYNQIVTPENIDYLEYHHPELAVAIGNNPEGFNKAALIYNSIKKYIPNATNSKRESQRAQQNMMKPKSMSSVGMTQNMDKPSAGLSQAQKDANWARMQQDMKRV